MIDNDIIQSVWPEWVLEKQIGKGSYGTVYKAVRCDNGVTGYSAIKIINIPQDESELETLAYEGFDVDATRTYYLSMVDNFINEIKLMESLKGMDNIASVEDYHVLEKKDEFGWVIFIRMELLTPLTKYLSQKRLSESEIIRLGRDICSALEVCRQKKIIHRDIKPENIFVNSSGTFKLGDFGIAKELDDMTGSIMLRGTMNYMAPEVASGIRYDHRVDIYSLGLVLYKLSNNNRLPFTPDKQLLTPEERREIVEKRLTGKAIPNPANASKELSKVILKACSFDPKNRYKEASELKKALLNADENRFVSFFREKKALLAGIAAGAVALLFMSLIIIASFRNIPLENDHSPLPSSLVDNRTPEATPTNTPGKTNEPSPMPSPSRTPEPSPSDTPKPEITPTPEAVYDPCLEGHSFGEWITEINPSYTDTGLKSRICSLCGYYESEDIPKLICSHPSLETYSADLDYHYYTCEICGETISHEPHTFTLDEYTPPTGKEDGFEIYSCDICGYGIINDIPRYENVLCDDESTLYVSPINDNEYTVLGRNYNSGDFNGIVEIPYMINSHYITEISSDAFMDDAQIKSVVIPGSIKKINSNAFNHCTNINKITYYGIASNWMALNEDNPFLGIPTLTVRCLDASLQYSYGILVE